MKTAHSCFLLLLMLLQSILLFAQQEPCATVAVTDEFRSLNVENGSQMEKLLPVRYQSNFSSVRLHTLIDTIPVVVHVVDNTGTINSLVSDSDIFLMLENLNLDLAKMNPDTALIPAPFQALSASLPFRVCLAQRDPDGRISTGIIRVNSTHSAFQGTASHMLDIQDTATGGSVRWPYSFAFNIYITNCVGFLGGFTLQNHQPIIIDYATVGGRTLTHEMGHSMGRVHIWGPTSAGSCTDDDGIADTPLQFESTDFCPAFPAYDSCTSTGNGILFVNFMDYSSCRYMFTADQASAMTNIFYLNHSDLLTSNACVPVPPRDATPSLFAIQQIMCNPIQFQVVVRNLGYDTLASLDVSYHYDSDPDILIPWSGSLALTDSAFISLPSVTLSPGLHTLSLSTQNPNGLQDLDPANDTITYSFLVNAGTAVPFYEPFDDTSFLSQHHWLILNPDADSMWRWSDLAGHYGMGAVVMNNHDLSIPYNETDDLINNLDLVSGDSAVLSFWEAYTWTSNVPTSSDTLEIGISTDGGNHWTMIARYMKDSLTTAPPENSLTFFIPDSTQWQEKILNLTPYLSGTINGCVSIRFRNISDFCKQLWLDDINFTVVPVSIEEKELKTVRCFPNPAGDWIQIEGEDFSKLHPGLVRMTDMYGQEFISRKLTSPYERIEIKNFPSGIYILTLSDGHSARTVKVMKY